MNCWHCKKKLIWGGDHTYEDYGMDGDGVVTNLSCPNEDCGVENVFVYMNLEDNQGMTTLNEMEEKVRNL